MAADGKIASDFEKIIQAGRERSKNEKLAARIFGKDRGSSVPLKATAGGTMASRVGVKKRVASSGPRAPAGDVNGEWTHDLHDSVTPSGAAPPPSDSLAARITNPAAAGPAASRRRQRQAAKVAQALIRTELVRSEPKPAAAPQVNNVSSALAGLKKGMSIRGLAGPFVVRAQNFAPGTTAADIESAVTPVGGIVQSCRLLKTNPIVIAEIVLESKEGADNVIATFDKQTADGRVLSVYYPPALTQPAPPSAPRAQRDESSMVIDGSLGFDDPMDADNDAVRKAPRGPARGAAGGGAGGGLYSDGLIRGSRRGRGLQRGGRGGSGR